MQTVAVFTPDRRDILPDAAEIAKTLRSEADPGRDTAASLVLFYGFSLFAATLGMTAALDRFRADPGAGLDDLMEPVGAFEDRLGYKAFTERARRYRPA